MIRQMIGVDALKGTAAATRKKFRPTPLFRPVDFIGGDATLNKRIGFNSFAADLAVLIRMFFVSDTAERLAAPFRCDHVAAATDHGRKHETGREAKNEELDTPTPITEAAC